MIAFCCVLIYMMLFYNKAGMVASIALVANLFFLFGVLASFGAVLTLPGIAGIVLTMGMAVDGQRPRSTNVSKRSCGAARGIEVSP